MFNPYDESCHAGTLTGMNRRAIGLAGPVFTPLLSVKDTQKLYPAVIEATRPLAEKYAGVAELDPQAVVAYMQQTYNPPTATSPSQDKLLFLAAKLVADKDTNIKELKKKLTVVIQLQSNKTAAVIDKAKYQKVIDDLPVEAKKAQDALDVAMMALTAAVDDTDKAFIAFVDWIQQSCKDAVNNTSVWKEALLGSVFALFTAGGSFAPAYAKIKSGSDLLKGIDLGQGQSAMNLLSGIIYNIWDGKNKGSGAPLQEITTAANPPLIYKGKKISGIRIASDGRGVFCYGGYNVYFKPGEVVLSATPGSPWDAPGEWKFQTKDVGKGKATRLKYTGPSGKPYAYMPIAPFWNTQVLPRIDKQAALWPPVQAAFANLETITQAGKEAAAMIAQANQAALVASGDLDTAFAEIKKQFSFGTGFLQGYSDVLIQLAKTVGDLTSTAVTVTKSLETADLADNALDTAYNKAQALYAAALPEQDPAKRAAAMQTAAGAALLAVSAKTKAEAAVAAAQAAVSKLGEAQTAATAIKQAHDLSGWTSYFTKVANTLTKAQPLLQKCQTRLADLGPKSDKLKADADAAAQQAVAGTGVPPPPSSTDTATTTTTTTNETLPAKTNVAVPLALGIIGIAAALRG